jgi:hypothetical protein
MEAGNLESKNYFLDLIQKLAFKKEAKYKIFDKNKTSYKIVKHEV